jgi:hypothetical protein
MTNEQTDPNLISNGILTGVSTGCVTLTMVHEDYYMRASLSPDEARAIRDQLTRAIDAAERAPDARRLDIRVIDSS